MVEVIGRLPPQVRPEATRRIEQALTLDPVPPRLVHGDLAGSNLRWRLDGSLSGVLDWDLAQPFDPAVDTACLSWFGWDTVQAAVDSQTYARARTWYRTFVFENIAAAINNGEDVATVSDCVARAARRLFDDLGATP